MPQVCVLLPCLNEESALPALLERCAAVQRQLQPAYDLIVLVVDDGSADATAEIARHGRSPLYVQLVQHSRNLGLGAALSTGINWFNQSDPRTRHSHDALVVMDADGTHPPELIPAMLPLMSQCDVVIASRYAPHGAEHGLSYSRRLYSRLASRALRVLCPIRGVRDYTCGFRLYSRGALDNAASRFGDALITERGFTCMAELLCKLARSGARCCEVPLELHYELKRGSSKMNVPATIRRYAVLACRLMFDPRFR